LYLKAVRVHMCMQTVLWPPSMAEWKMAVLNEDILLGVLNKL